MNRQQTYQIAEFIFKQKRINEHKKVILELFKAVASRPNAGDDDVDVYEEVHDLYQQYKRFLDEEYTIDDVIKEYNSDLGSILEDDTLLDSVDDNKAIIIAAVFGFPAMVIANNLNDTP